MVFAGVLGQKKREIGRDKKTKREKNKKGGKCVQEREKKLQRLDLGCSGQWEEDEDEGGRGGRRIDGVEDGRWRGRRSRV